MLTSESKNILESIFCLQKWNEEGSYHNEFNDSFMIELGFTDDRESENYSEKSINESAEESILFSSDEKNTSNLSKGNNSKKEESTCDPSDLSKTNINSNSTIHTIKTLQDEPANINLESLKYEFVENHLNVGYNYDNYIASVMKSLTKFKHLNLVKEIQNRSINLPDNLKNFKHTLILDLDETLIHSEFENERENNGSPSVPLANCLQIKFFDKDINEDVNVKVYLRPGVREFLNEISKYFELGIFTASIKEYADSIIDVLDPKKEIFNFRLYRDSCIKIGRAYIKDLRIIKNRSLANLVLLDNSLYSFANQLSNGILIYSFYDDSSDKELANLLEYLTNYLEKCDDMRFVNEQVFNFQAILNEYSCYA